MNKTVTTLTLIALIAFGCEKEKIVEKEVEVPVNAETEIFSAPVLKDATIVDDKNLTATSVQADQGAGGSQIISVGYAGSPGLFARALIKFDLSSFPEDKEIKNVQLIFTEQRTSNRIPKIFVHKIASDWTQGTSDAGCQLDDWCNDFVTDITVGETDVTWKEATSGTTAWTAAGGDFDPAQSGTSHGKNASKSLFTSEKLIADVVGWLDGSIENHGWMLKIDEAEIQETGGEMQRYISNEGVVEVDNMKPRLLIEYYK